MRWIIAGLLALGTGTAVAGPSVEGTFVAQRPCEAVRSIRTGVNPGDVRLTPGGRYEALERNAPDGRYLRVRVPGAPQVEPRWVEASCGTLDTAAAKAPAASGTRPARERPQREAAGGREEATRNVLAVNWQNAFCELSPRTRECRAMDRGRIRGAATRFSIHGLWPDGERNCGSVRSDGRDWADLPPVPMSETTARALAPLMPGMLSHLDRHEWLAHGTCYRAAGGADEYYRDTIALVDALNASAVREVMEENVGRTIDTAQIADAFDVAFGRGAGERVEFECDRDLDSGRTLLVELKIHLEGRIGEDPDLGTLMRDARRVRPGCRRATIDPPGNQ